MTDAPWSTARVQVWHNKWLVGIIRVYAPIAVDAYVLDADDLAVFRAQTSAATATEDTSLLSVRLSCRQLQGAATAAVVRCAVLRHRAPRAPRALVKTLSVQEREFCLSKGITEGTYNTKHAEAARLYYTTIYIHTHTQLRLGHARERRCAPCAV